MSEFLSHLGGAAISGLKGSPLDRIINHLMGGQSGASGLQALVEKLRGGGLGDRVDSWVATGPNQDVQPAELERAIGTEEADRLAGEAGVQRGGLMAVLSGLLPRLVDGMTPNGRLPTRDADMPGGGGGFHDMLGGILGRLGGDAGAGQPGGAMGGGGGMGGILGALLGKIGLGGDQGTASEAPRHPGTGAGEQAGMPRFSEQPAGGGTAAPSSGPGGPPLPGGPTYRT